MGAGKLLMSILKRLPKSKTSGVLRAKEKIRRIQKDLDDYSKGASATGFRKQSTIDQRRKQALKDPRPIEDRANNVRREKKERVEKREKRLAMSPEERKKHDQERKEKLDESIAALKKAAKNLQETGEKAIPELSKTMDKFWSEVKKMRKKKK